MTNLEKYDNAFVDTLDVSKDELATLEYQGIKTWDSVGHMGLIGELEDIFGIEMEADDVIDFSSYERGKDIVKKYGVEL